VPAISDYALPLVGILFLVGGLGAGFLSGADSKTVWRGLIEGLGGLAPSVPLILMAASIRYIIDSGRVTDTILYSAAEPFTQLGAFPAVLVVYALALGIEFFIASGSAKAFLMMPIVLPLADLIGVTRQTAVRRISLVMGSLIWLIPPIPSSSLAWVSRSSVIQNGSAGQPNFGYGSFSQRLPFWESRWRSILVRSNGLPLP
jgi:uncharacterized ion transporter superfamily protein YfcC